MTNATQTNNPEPDKKSNTGRNLLIVLAAFLAFAVIYLLQTRNANNPENSAQTTPTPENPSKRPGSVSMQKDSLVLIIGNEFFVANELVENIDEYNPSKTPVFPCGESPKDDGNGWFCDPNKTDTWEKYTFEKRSDGYYLPFVPNHEGQIAQLSGLNTGDPNKDINWCKLHLYKNAPWIHIDISTGRVAIDPLKVIRIPARKSS